MTTCFTKMVSIETFYQLKLEDIRKIPFCSHLDSFVESIKTRYVLIITSSPYQLVTVKQKYFL